MYYAGLPANGSPGIAAPVADKPGIYMQAPSPYGPAPAGYPPSQLPPGLTPAPRYPPQAYAVVSTPGPAGYTTLPAAYSMPYSAIAAMPATSSPHAYISPGQYPGGMSYQVAMAPRSAQPSPYGTPVQAGAPLIAAGYTTVPGPMPGPRPRSFPVAATAAYPPGYPMPGAASAPIPFHGATAYGPPF